MKNILKNKLLSAGVLTASLLSTQANAGVDELFAAIDLATVAASVTAVGVLIIGINMVMKGISLGKRTINKA